MSRRLGCAAAALLLVVAASLARAEPGSGPTAGESANSPQVIGEIVIHSGDIFDTDDDAENRLLFRVANRLHRETRPGAIEHLLLFRTGDPYSSSLLQESERALRETGYLYDAEVRPVPRGDGVVDVHVYTRDVWTLQAGIGFGRSGGENSARLGIEDKNFLGWGKWVKLERSSGVDRTSTLFSYEDPSLLGTRLCLGLAHEDNSDGGGDRIRFERPFYSLGTRWAAGISAVTDDRVDTLYDLGAPVGSFRHDSEFVEAYGGLALRGSDRLTRRLRAGFTYARDGFGVDESGAMPGPLPAGRTLAYPWIELEAIRDGFVEVHDLDRLHRTEDVNMGGRLRLRLGWSDAAWGADASRGIVELEAGHGLRLGTGRFALADLHASGRLGEVGAENAVVGGALRYYRRNWGRHLLYVGLQADAAFRLDGENQLLLGGDSGLRGYPLRYQTGDRRVLLTVEQRLFTDWHPLRLLRVGAAAFVDVGRAWFDGAGASGPDRGWLRDVGVGVRLGSSRSAHGGMVHIDLAAPLDGSGSISNVQILVSTKQSF